MELHMQDVFYTMQKWNIKFMNVKNLDLHQT